MTRQPYSLFMLLIVLLLQTACSSSILQLRDQLDLHRGTFRQKLAGKKELTAKFLACTRQAHDELPGDRRDTETSPQALAQLIQEGQATSVRPLADVQSLGGVRERVQRRADGLGPRQLDHR